MEATDRPEPVVLSEVHVPQAMELSQEAGWNQLPADWQLFMSQGQVFGIFIGPVLAATAAIIPYGQHHAWIGMVLTRKNWRGQGLGTALLNTCIAELEGMERTALLDATPAGEPIYRALGFEPVEAFTRWQGQGGAKASSRVASSDNLAIEAANRAFGADRTFLLEDFAGRCPTARRSRPDGAAHCFGRDGRVATQIGPVVGSDEASITQLTGDVIAALEGPVFLDVADSSAGLCDRLQADGFERQRPFLRMKKGPHSAPGISRETAVIAGPEFG